MAQFVIIRDDGTRDLVEGSSISDVANRYGWPGNGDIVEFNDGDKTDRNFPTVEDQNDELNSTKGKK